MSVRRAFLAWLILMPLVVTGCMVGPDWEPLTAPLADGWMDDGAPGLLAEPSEHPDWWKAFNDPALDRLIEEARAQNLSVQAAGIRMVQARVARSLAVVQLFPAVFGTSATAAHVNQSENVEVPADVTIESAGAQVGPLTLGDIQAPATVAGRGSFDVYQVGFDAFWELDVWGKNRRRVNAAHNTVIAAVNDYDDVMVSLLGEVASNYVTYRTLQQRLQFTRENAALQERAVAVAERRLRDGEVTEADMYLGRTLLARTKSRIPALEDELRRTQTTLAVLLGRAPESLDEFLGEPAPIPAAPPEVALGIPADLLRRRPDIQRAEYLVRAQNERVGKAKANTLPSFALFGSLGLASSSSKEFTSSDSIGGAYGGGIFWNLFLMPALLDLLRVEDAKYWEAVIEYQDTVIRAAKEVEDATSGVLRSRELLQLQEQGLASASRSVEVIAAEYENGGLDFDYLRTALEDRVEQQDRVTATRGTNALQHIALYKALGGGWQIRQGHAFVNPDLAKKMRVRTDWERYVAPDVIGTGYDKNYNYLEKKR